MNTGGKLMFCSIKNFLRGMGMAGAIALTVTGTAQATFFDSFLTANAQNTLRDDSFEAWVDRSAGSDVGDGVFGVGDVLVGFLR